MKLKTYLITTTGDLKFEVSAPSRTLAILSWRGSHSRLWNLNILKVSVKRTALDA
jgi:hypothetical protein